MAKLILLSTYLQMWACVKHARGVEVELHPFSLLSLGVGEWPSHTVAQRILVPAEQVGLGVPEPIWIFLRRQKSLACAKNQPTLSKQWPGHYTGTSIQIPDLCR